MAAHPIIRTSAHDYLRQERLADSKSEFLNGEVYAMSGGSLRHGLISAALITELSISLRGRPCSTTTSDTRVEIAARNSYFYPDVTVICGTPELTDAAQDTLKNPTVIFEVLSPSTEAFDRGTKFAMYRTLSSLQEYVLVSQDEPAVEVFRRTAEGWTLSEFRGLESSLELKSIPVQIALQQIYERVSFDPSPSE